VNIRLSSATSNPSNGLERTSTVFGQQGPRQSVNSHLPTDSWGGTRFTRTGNIFSSTGTYGTTNTRVNAGRQVPPSISKMSDDAIATMITEISAEIASTLPDGGEGVDVEAIVTEELYSTENGRIPLSERVAQRIAADQEEIQEKITAVFKARAEELQKMQMMASMMGSMGGMGGIASQMIKMEIAQEGEKLKEEQKKAASEAQEQIQEKIGKRFRDAEKEVRMKAVSVTFNERDRKAGQLQQRQLATVASSGNDDPDEQASIESTDNQITALITANSPVGELGVVRDWEPEFEDSRGQAS
jgi:hypothetical protein